MKITLAACAAALPICAAIVVLTGSYRDEVLGGLFFVSLLILFSETIFRLHNYVILHTDQFDVSEWPWGGWIGKGIFLREIHDVHYEAIDSVDLGDEGVVLVRYHPRMFEGRYSTMTFTASFRPKEPKVVAREIGRRVGSQAGQVSN